MRVPSSSASPYLPSTVAEPSPSSCRRPYRGNTHRSPAVLRSQQAQAPRDEIDDAIEAGWDEQEEEERRLEREREEEEARQRRRRAHVRAAAGTDLAQTDGGLAAIFAADQALENRHGGVRRP